MIAVLGEPCLFVLLKIVGSTPSTEFCHRPRDAPISALSTDRSSAAMRDSPTNHFQNSLAPKILST